MLEFAWWWMIFALPLPLLLLISKKQAAQKESTPQAIRVPYFAIWTSDANAAPAPTKRSTRLAIWLLWLLVIVAATRPQWVGDPIELPASGRSIMLAVDISESMTEQDLKVNGREVDRLSVVKHVLEQFIEGRTGDRLGLILFGTQAYLQTPLSFDLETLNVMLTEAEIGLAGPNTAMGDAIGLAIKRLQSQPEDQRTLILLTDGQDTASRVNPLKAAELAQSANVKIYTIGVGADIAYRRTMFGTMQVNPSRDLDEKTLKGIADKTGGDYFRARSTDELEAVYQAIDKLEPVEVEKKTYRPTSDLFYWPLAFFIILWLARHSPWRSVMRKRSALSQSEVSNNAG